MRIAENAQGAQITFRLGKDRRTVGVATMKKKFVLDDALARPDMDPVCPSDDVHLFGPVEVSYFGTQREKIHPGIVGQKSSLLFFVGENVLTDNPNVADHALAELRGPVIAPCSRRGSDNRRHDR
jgi:hypothetical protein